MFNAYRLALWQKVESGEPYRCGKCASRIADGPRYVLVQFGQVKDIRCPDCYNGKQCMELERMERALAPKPEQRGAGLWP